MDTRTAEIVKFLIIQIGRQVPAHFAGSLFLLFLVSIKGFSMLELFAFYLPTFIAAIVLIPMFKNLNSKRSLLYTFGFVAIFYPALLLVSGPVPLALLALFHGSTALFYWTVINTLYFDLRKGDNAFLSSIHFGTFAAIALIFPALAGITAEGFGYASLFFLNSILVIPLLIYTAKSKIKRISYDLKQALKEVKPYRELLFLEGFHHLTFIVLVPIFSLFFFTTPLSLGLFLSYLGAIAIVTSLIISRISDKIFKRSIFIIPISILLALLTISLAFSRDIVTWTIMVGIFSFVKQLGYPFFTVILLDTQKNTANAIAAREFIFNVARLFGALVCIGFFLLGIPFASFLFVGVVFLAYPVLVKKRFGLN